MLLARQARVGLVLRRGPSRQVCTLAWDRTSDIFSLGQWLKGSIYEDLSDLSPDGKYFIYFALNGRWKSETGGSWTAISQVPYLKAIALYRTNAYWAGGGLFTSDRTYWLNSDQSENPLIRTTLVSRDQDFDPATACGGHGNYFGRLIRDGWTCIEDFKNAKSDQSFIFERPLRRGWTLRKISHVQIDRPQGKRINWDEHELVHFVSGRCEAHPDWEWADVDEMRLVWASGGKLLAGRIDDQGLGATEVLYDFNDMTFEAIKAPY